MPAVKSIGDAAGRAIPGAGAPKRNPDPKKIAEAARQFEALLIGQLLKTARGSSGSGWMGTGDDPAGAQAIDVAEEQFAQSLAQQGGLGLARLVVAGLRQKTDAAGTPDSPLAAPFVSSSVRPR